MTHTQRAALPLKSDKDVIAELLAIIRLLIQGHENAEVASRLAALESWRSGVEAVWPQITKEG